MKLRNFIKKVLIEETENVGLSKSDLLLITKDNGLDSAIKAAGGNENYAEAVYGTTSPEEFMDRFRNLKIKKKIGWIYFVDDNDENIFWIPLDKEVNVIRLVVNYKKVWSVLIKVFQVKKIQTFLREWFSKFNDRLAGAIRYFESSKTPMYEHIIKLSLNEGNEFLKMRRRISELDDYVDYWLKNDRIKLGGWETPEDWLEFIAGDIAETLYYDYFSDMDDTSKEWGEIYDFIVGYIKKNHKDNIIKRYKELKRI